ncbi:MAG TPA: DnaJ domain-containing protein [Pyrinomonadaceae bacterium]|nr:DnaJ domain-containing protein [Pyrinomonadaceae bacterium]
MSLYDSTKDYYSILGAEEDASPGDIERLYKRLAVRHHPDRGGDEEEMKSLNEAYGVLRDKEARKAYDAERLKPAADPDHEIHTSPPLEVSAAAGQSLGALLFIGAGLVLALLVRFQWIWFLWPLAILATCLVVVGLIMAHGALRRIEDEQRAARRWFGVTLEVMFWAIVLGGGYGIYLVLR